MKASIEEVGVDKVPFVRVELGANLIGGQPISIANIREVEKVCRPLGVMLVLDASLLADNLYLIKVREEEFKDWELGDIVKEIASHFDLIYFSARKLGFARGGGIALRTKELYDRMKEFVTLFRRFPDLWRHVGA